MVHVINESLGISEAVSRLGTMKRIVAETLQISESATRLGSLKRFVNEGISTIEGLIKLVLTDTTVLITTTLKTSDKSKTARGGDTSKKVKTYKTDETSRGD